MGFFAGDVLRWVICSVHMWDVEKRADFPMYPRTMGWAISTGAGVLALLARFENVRGVPLGDGVSCGASGQWSFRVPFCYGFARYLLFGLRSPDRSLCDSRDV